MAADSHTADALREILATCADPLNRACEEYAKLARELAEANERLSQAMRNHGEQLMALHAQRSETRRTAAALHACEGLDTVDLEANEKGWLCGLAHDAARVERDLNNAFRARCVGNTMDDDPVCCQSYEAHEQAQPCPPGCCVMADQKDVRAVLEAIEREDKPEASAPCVAVPIVKGRALTPQESWADRCGIDRADERAIEPHIYGWPDKYAIFRDGWDAACLTVAQYLKDGETVAEAMERNWLDSQNALGLFAKERIAKEQVMGVLRRLYDAFPDCEGGEQGAACVEARAILATAGNHERNGE